MIVNEAIVPAPDKVVVRQSRAPQAAQNSLGGLASSPHLPQRTPVSLPARTPSKNILSVIPASLTAEQAPQHGGGVAAQGMGEAHAGGVDLARRGLAAKLGDDLDNLSRPGGPDRVALGLESAGGIDGDLASEARRAFL